MTNLSLTGVVLTGGKSSRMGTDKAFLPLPGGAEGDTFLSHTVDLLRLLPETVLSVAEQDTKYAPFGLRQIADRWPGIGPMGGIASVLQVVESDAVLVLACDTPFVSSELIERLCKTYAAMPKGGCLYCQDGAGHIQPLCAVYPKAALPVLLACIEEGRFSLRTVFERMPAQPLLLDASLAEQAAANINTPEEYAALGRQK